MPKNYVLLETVTVGAAGAASVTFNSIPQSGYTDLKISISAKADRAGYEGVGMLLSFNGSTSTFSSRVLYGTGSGTGSFTLARYAGDANGPTATANTFASTDLYIPNYTSSNNKSYSSDSTQENNGTSAYAYLVAGLWSTTSAITSITLTPDGGSNFTQYSTFSLYGIAAIGSTPVIAPKATGGDIIDYDGTYWIHTFLSSGTFTPAVGLSCDYLVIAGGGAGGANRGGGGGAGGYLTSSFSAASSTNYTVTVGAGGTGTSTNGTSGSNSSLSSFIAIGGGFGTQIDETINGGNGGSGGGASGSTAARTGGNPTSGQGFKGGDTVANSQGSGAGGGGAGAAGGNVTSVGGASGAGGSGLASSITGTSVTRAGGGGGGGTTAAAGGAGGGGAGGSGISGTGNPGVAGTANTGGGGGGSGRTINGANGGSGIVIVRYLAV